ncbi:phage tail domain-containing protein [Microbacterium thalli]|uniref:phage tail domain-containing protein n=1 Tax=Microbacterium thalli TaxID=3027921 RepID=UPI0023664AD2|nr:phage tail domain-containing protein [Microbacterium thalli]MDD7930065.1 phage tail family protein [Microbacterium thalli]
MSSPLVLSTGPSTPAPVPVDQWESISVEWFGADGSYWDLADGLEGVVLQAFGTEGMHDPELTKYASKGRAVPGKRQRGWRAEERKVFWPVLVYADGSPEWVDTYGRFFGSIDPERPGRWRVGFRGVYRELLLTGVYERPHSFETHPTVFGWGRFGVELEAAQPFWIGTAIETPAFGAPAPVPFIQPPGAPDFHVSAAENSSTATIDNPGNVEAWPKWEIVASASVPGGVITLGTGGVTATIPFALAEGDVLLIDTDPRNVTATLNGEDVTQPLGLVPWSAVAPGESVALSIDIPQGVTVQATLRPLYFRAIG